MRAFTLLFTALLALLLSACGNDGSCEVTLTCDPPPESGGGGTTAQASGGGGAGAAGGSGGGAATKPNGDACAGAAECDSGFCTDGVCCEAACSGGCEACGVAGAEGTCVPHDAASDPEQACSSGAGFCDGHGTCTDGTQAWQTEVGNNSGQAVSLVATAADGSIAIAGVHTGVTAFSFGGDSISPGVFVGRLTEGGSPDWGATYNGCLANETHTVQALATAPNGNTILAGSCDQKRYIRAYGSGGAQLWTHNLVDAFYWTIRLATDSSSNVHVGGHTAYLGLDFDGNAVGPENGDEYGFVVKLDSAGSYQWSHTFGGSGANVYGSDIEVTAADDVVALFRFQGTVQFGNDTLTATGSNGVLLNIATTSTINWARQFAGGVYDQPAGLGVGPDGFHVASCYGEDINLGGGTLDHLGSYDVFRLHLDSGGDHVSSAGYGTTAREVAPALEADGRGNIVLILSEGTADFGGGPVDAAGVVKLGAEGTFLWSHETAINGFSDVAVGANGTVIVAGDDLVTAYAP